MVGKAELACLRLELCQLRSFSCDCQTGLGMLSREFRERPECRGKAFLGYEPAGLQKPKPAIGGQASDLERDLVERDPGSMDSDFSRVASKRLELFGERLGSNQDQ